MSRQVIGAIDLTNQRLKKSGGEDAYAKDFAFFLTEQSSESF